MNLQRECSQKMNEEELVKEINRFLKERRYLVVMDDVWELDVWNRLKFAFPDTNNGSRIIFTTRKNDVGLDADPKSLLHELKPLNKDDSWELFIKKVLSMEEITLSEELIAVGRKIVQKCGGLPLAILVLGGFLSKRGKNFGEWSKFVACVNRQLNEGQASCSQILALSYNDLPFYLKTCFLYLGIFPKDYEIPARKLIKLWISEGFVQRRGDEVMEDVAEYYLEELIDRCMVQVTGRRLDGKIKKCRIHDLLRDLAITKAEEVKFFHIDHPSANSSSTSYPSLNKVRRFVVHSTIHNFCLMQSHQSIRSAFYFISSDCTYGAIHSSMGFGMLRVLHLCCSTRGPLLPKSIGKLIHLRYLSLECVGVEMFSSTIGKLRNLEILYLKYLKLNKCPGRDSISKMEHLRHLNWKFNIVSNGTRNPLMPLDPPSGNSSSIRNLQTLWGLVVDKHSVVKDGWDKYTNIRKLRLSNYGDIESQVEGIAGWIAKLEHLESLYLSFEKEKFRNPIERLNIFSRNHFNFYKLKLDNVWIEKLPDPCEIPSSLSHLTLTRCTLGEAVLPVLGKLPKLKYLKMWNVSEVKHIIFVSGGFPQLQELVLHAIYDLEELTVEEGALPCLRDLSIYICPRLKALPDGLRQCLKTS